MRFFESEIRCTIPENDRPRNDSISEAIYTSSALPRAFPPCSIAVHYFRRSRRRLHDRSWIAIQRWNGFGGSASLAQTAVVASRPLSNARRAHVHTLLRERARTRIRVFAVSEDKTRPMQCRGRYTGAQCALGKRQRKREERKREKEVPYSRLLKMHWQ